MIWLWLVIALLILIMIVICIALYYRKKAKRQQEMNAIIYGAGIGHDGDLVEKDLSGKGGKHRQSQFNDHADIMRETMIDTPDDDDDTPLAADGEI